MRLSTKVRYGVRAMLDLALHDAAAAVSSRDVAERQATDVPTFVDDPSVSEKYMGQLLAQLRTAGLVRSIRGQGGGYQLARSPEEIDVLSVVLAFEGSLSLLECVDDPSVCERSANCAARECWCRLNQALDEPLRTTTLAHLAQRQRALDEVET